MLDGEDWVELDPNTLVSMNMWGFTPNIIKEIAGKFGDFQNVLNDNPEKGEMFIPNVVVGDIVLLEAGEEVPADAVILRCMNLIMNESSLTGEPQCSKSTNPDEFDKNATYPSNHIMKGCTVMEGDCIAEVFAVGDKTACGKVFEAAQVKDGEATPLSEKLDELAGLITKTSYGIAILIVLGRLIRHALILPETNYVSLFGYLGVSLVIAGFIYWGLNKKKNDDNEESIEL